LQAFADQQQYIKRTYNKTAIKRVFEVSDVLGISHYAPMPLRSMSPASFEVSWLKHYAAIITQIVISLSLHSIYNSFALVQPQCYLLLPLQLMSQHLCVPAEGD
jgi:hypothetical protein